MATQIFLSGGAINITGDTFTNTLVINTAHFDWKKKGSNYFARDGIENQSYDLGAIANIEDQNEVAYSDDAALIKFLNDATSTSTKSKDRTSKTIIVKFNRVTNSTALTNPVSIDDTSIVVDSATGIIVGSYLIFFSPDDKRFMVARATDITGAPTIVIDTPFDFAYPAGTFVDVAITNLKSIGTLASPKVYGLRGTGSPPGVNITAMIERIIITCTTSSPVNLSLFMNLAKLTNGLVLRRRDGKNENIFNVKDNFELSGILFDYDPLAALNPAQGVDGVKARLTFSRFGTVKELPIGTDLELLVQDDIETAQSGDSITILEVTAEGYILEENV